jgi:molybdopterin-containing oxidoreductase family iron-sulfur binding subunit
MERRNFVKTILTLSTVISTGCKRPGLFFPSKVKDDNSKSFGNRLNFMTTFPNSFLPIGIRVETFNDKPFRIVGNQSHPNNRGILPAYSLASIYNLYDPFRFNKPKIKNRSVTINNGLGLLFEKLKGEIDRGKVIIFISEIINSPSVNELLISFNKDYENIFFYQLPSLNYYYNQQEANRILYNSAFYPMKDISNSDLILNFRRDFLNNDLLMPYYTSRFRLHKPTLVTFENTFTLTGANSNFRYAVERKDFEYLLLVILKETCKLNNNNKILSFLNKFDLTYQYFPPNLIELLQATNRKRLSVLVDDTLPPTCHILAELIENVWNGDSFGSCSKLELPDYYNELNKLVQMLSNDNVGSIIFLENNPYFAGKNDVIHLIDSLPTSEFVTFSMYYDEIARRSDFYFPTKHYLEFWQDYRNIDGSISAQQQIVFPLNRDSISVGEFLLSFRNFLRNGEVKIPDYLSYLKGKYLNSSTEAEFIDSMRNGFFAEKVDRSVLREKHKIDYQNVYSYLEREMVPDKFEKITLELFPNSKFLDATYSNNVYVKELPDPITGMSWDNVVYVGKKVAEEFELQTGDLVQIKSKLNEVDCKLPVYVSEYFAPSAIYGYLGFGSFYENEIFKLGNENLSKLIKPIDKKRGNIHTTDYVIPISLTKLNKKKDITFVASQSNIYEKSTLKQTLNKFEYRPEVSIYGAAEKTDRNWVMIINLDSCVGCNLCLIACQLENNIPVVGNGEVRKERDMYWIRVQKYEFNEGKHLLFLPIMCQQCSSAPCESVCPVGATSHSSDGLNEMTYNRCIGSRFCMANCPYKVRKFNFDSSDKVHPNYIQQLTNPLVTVRSRGVAEKCTFCIHRIREAKQKAILSGEDESKFTIRTACEEICPTNAIQFGRRKILDNNEISDQMYQLLTQFNTQPNVYFVVKFNNAK